MQHTDPIDRIRAQWTAERPDLSSDGFALVGRLLLLGRVLTRRVETVLAKEGLSLWAFDVLATLRRGGPPFRRTPGDLARDTMLTAGAMTNRIDRLEAEGLVQRLADAQDRRSLQVQLTAKGRRLVDRALASRFDEAEDAASVLSPAERSRLEPLLRKLLLGLSPAPGE